IQQIAIAVLQILIYLQNRVPPVIHRDIKPDNILVDDAINVYLVDFGFARIGEGEVGVSSVVKGTLGFMPPEQMFNRQLTEASDLYGLGVTLICLLTGTKTLEVGKLVDSDYRVTFKPLLPKLSIGWVNWLEKMVQPQLKDRFPNAEAALAGMPTHPMRVPEVQLSQTVLAFTANRRGETISQILTINNSIADTTLEGCWEVPPHPSDPPHTPDAHAWISVRPKQFQGNHNKCQVVVDTSKLMSGKTYTRQLLLQTNALPRTTPITLQIKTVALPTISTRLPLTALALLFSSVLLITWMIGQVSAGFGMGGNAPTPLPIAFLAGAAAGFQLAAWAIATAGARAGSTTSLVAGVISIILAGVLASSSSLETSGLGVSIIAGIGGLNGIMMGIPAGTATEYLIGRGFPKGYAVLLSLLVIATAISTGTVALLGMTGLLPMVGLVGSYLGLAGVTTHFVLTRVKLLKSYRQYERHLIQP
ncbi:MAG TPA: protein kinase, partial [Coleofasciculaceae cyanobacterium]